MQHCEKHLPIPYAILNRHGALLGMSARFSEMTDAHDFCSETLEVWASQAWDILLEKVDRYGAHSIDRTFQPRGAKRALPCCVELRRVSGGSDVCIQILDDSRAVQKEMSLQSLATIIQDNNKQLSLQKRRLQEILDCMTHGLFCINGDLRICEPISPSCERDIFGANIRGRSIEDVMYSTLPADEIAMVRSALIASFEADEIQWDLCSDDLPVELRLSSRASPGDRGTLLRISHTPIWSEDGTLRRVMILCEDVTREKALEEGLNEERRLKNYQLNILEKILELDAPTVESLLKRSARLVQLRQFASQLYADGTLSRDLHTLKGELRAYGWTEASSAIHLIEDRLSLLKGSSQSLSDAEWASLLKPLAEFHTLCAEIGHRLFGIEDPVSQERLADLFRQFSLLDDITEQLLSHSLQKGDQSVYRSRLKEVVSEIQPFIQSQSLPQQDQAGKVNFDRILEVAESDLDGKADIADLSALYQAGIAMARSFLSLSTSSTLPTHLEGLKRLRKMAATLRAEISSLESSGCLQIGDNDQVGRDLHAMVVLAQELRLTLLSQRLSTMEALIDQPFSELKIQKTLAQTEHLTDLYLLFLEGLEDEGEPSHGIVQTLARFETLAATKSQLEEWEQGGSRTAKALRANEPFAPRLNSFQLVADLTALASLGPQTRSTPNEATAMTSIVSSNLEELRIFLSKISLGQNFDSHLAQDSAKRMLALLDQRPFGTLKKRLAQLVRSTSESLGKNISLAFQGGDVLIDADHMNRLYEALVHLVRNAIDHGIEFPHERAMVKKSVHATIRIEASCSEQEEVIVTVADDGSGIDTQKLAHRAVVRGVITEQQHKALTQQEALDLVFQVGLTTAENITHISGRGVGMDAVRNFILSIGGQLSIQSERGKGTAFSIYIPTQTVLARTTNNWRNIG